MLMKNKKKSKKTKKFRVKKTKKAKKGKIFKKPRHLRGSRPKPKTSGRNEKVKKLTSVEKKMQSLTRIADELVGKGRKRGFITYDEILKIFPDIENNILFLDELYEKFAIAGIDVLEGGNLLNLDVE